MSLTLLDWRRKTAELWSEARRSSPTDPKDALDRFRLGKDDLFRLHPDTPLAADALDGFSGLRYWDHDPTLRFSAPVEPMAAEPTTATSVSGDTFALRRIGLARLPVGDLEVYWIDVYGGGIFVPFRDGTSGTETYGAGRYLLDTVKGADLGGDADGLVLDFNYAYHPSCVYDAKWSCPLAPRANWLSVPIEAGERLGAGLQGRPR